MSTDSSLSRKRKRPSSADDADADIVTAKNDLISRPERHYVPEAAEAQESETDDIASAATSSDIPGTDDEAETEPDQWQHRQYVSDQEGAEDLTHDTESDEKSSDDDEDPDDDSGKAASQSATFVGKKRKRYGAEQASLEDELKRIPLKTIVKAQKKLTSTQKARSRLTEGREAEESELRKHGRRGRDAPRRADIAIDTVVDRRPNRAKSDASSRPSARTQDGEVQRLRKSSSVRSDKHAPQEVSSKRAVSRRRTVVDVPGNPTRDPRFENLGAGRDDRAFRASYTFLTDARKEEIQRLKTALQVTKKKHGAVDGVERAAMERELTRLQSTQAQVDKISREHDSMKTWKHSEQVKRAEGKSPFHLKRAQVKTLLEDERMKSISKDKRKLRKVEMRKVQNERRKSFKSAPPVRAG